MPPPFKKIVPTVNAYSQARGGDANATFDDRCNAAVGGRSVLDIALSGD
jgi:hypothetical protein